MSMLASFEQQIAALPEVSVHPHRFGGREFRIGSAELGHIHSDGTLDIPFPRDLRDALLNAGLVQEHRWVPNSGWTTFRLRGERELPRALWLMRLSYLRYTLKKVSDPLDTLQRASEELGLSSQLKALLKKHLPANGFRPRTDH
jgi:hypothetical protein